jgi:hypothetical protein
MKILLPISPSIIKIELNVISPLSFDYRSYVIINLMNVQRALYMQTRDYYSYLTLRDMFNGLKKLNKLEDKYISLYYELTGEKVRKVDYKNHEITFLKSKLKGIQERKLNHEINGLMHNRLIERETECINELNNLSI